MAVTSIWHSEEQRAVGKGDVVGEIDWVLTETETDTAVVVKVDRIVDTVVLAGRVVVMSWVEPGAVVVTVLAGMTIVLKKVLTLVDICVCVGPETVCVDVTGNCRHTKISQV